MSNEIEESLATIYKMIAPVAHERGSCHTLRNLNLLSAMPFQPPTEWKAVVFKSDFAGILTQLNAVFIYYRENARAINSASIDIHLREVTNFILGIGIFRYILVSYMYRSGIPNVTYISSKAIGLISIIDDILIEYSVIDRVIILINEYYSPAFREDEESTISCRYKPPTHITIDDPRTRDHYNCSIFPILTYSRRSDIMLSTYDNYKFLSIKFHKQSKDIATRATKIKGLISDMYSLISSEKNVKAIRLLKEYYPEVDIKELDNILARDVAPKLQLIK